MAGGLNIISEEDFLHADSDTARGWTHRSLNSIEESISIMTKQNLQQHGQIDEKLDVILRFQETCPGRNYRPVVDKLVVAGMSFVGGFVAFIIALKAKIITLMGQVQ